MVTHDASMFRVSASSLLFSSPLSFTVFLAIFLCEMKPVWSEEESSDAQDASFHKCAQNLKQEADSW